MITLRGAEPFAVGGRRLCFVHPGNPALCVKVNRTDDDRFGRLDKPGRLVPARFRRSIDDNQHERTILSALQRRLRDRFAHLPRCHGAVDTDLGPGIVLDLIRDADGRIARTVRNLACDGIPLASLRTAFDDFGEFLLRENIVTRALLDHNIVARHEPDGAWTLFLIDGYGDPAFIPVASLVRPVGARRIRRRLDDAWQRFEQLERSNPTRDAWDDSRWSQGFLNHRGDTPDAKPR